MVATLPVARVPDSALHVMLAVWAALSFVASASAELALICSFDRSAICTKPLPELEEAELVEPVVLLPPPPLEEDEPPEDEPTAPLTAVTVPAIGAVSTVPLTVVWAEVTFACAVATRAS